MGEFSSSDCSWKKMVIAKANNKWISTIKSELNEENCVNTMNFSIGDEKPVDNVKKELEDDEQNGDTPVDMVQEMDPLNLYEPVKLQQYRRKSIKQTKVSKQESDEERAARLAKMSAYAAQRLANETPEQRALRLKRMSEYAAKRLAQETTDQRSKRLARMSAYAAQRLAKETTEQRQMRLARMSAYAARRQAMKKTGNSTSESLYSTNSDYDMINILSNQS